MVYASLQNFCMVYFYNCIMKEGDFFYKKGWDFSSSPKIIYEFFNSSNILNDQHHNSLQFLKIHITYSTIEYL